MLLSEVLKLCGTLFEISLQLVTINMMKMHSTRFLRKRGNKSAIVLFLNILFYTFGHCMCYIYTLSPSVYLNTVGRHAL